tara:strand:- start:196 stop:636 length:441 start_codon:yes stop_codon:yes gene_type:complete
MKCPYCSHNSTKVTDKRPSKGLIRRRRECLKCKNRFTTYEKIELINLIVVKKGGGKEYFNKEKIRKGIHKATEKRNISSNIINQIISEIELDLKKNNTTEISSSIIGNLVISKLKDLDHVAYLRFASVYKDFKKPEEFHKELKNLK